MSSPHTRKTHTMKHFQPTPLAWALALSLPVWCAMSAHAQSTPNIGTVLQQIDPPRAPQTQPAPALPAVGQAPEPAMTALAAGPSVRVQTFEVLGNRALPTAELLALLDGEAGKAHTLAQLESLAQKITRQYRAKGYFVARAYIPAQEVSSGTVKIRVVEGNYGDFKLRNNSRVNDAVLQGVLDHIKGEDIVSLDTLERAMLIIHDTPGARVVQADVSPGDKVGTSDFAVQTVATPAHSGHVALDNYGSVYTGRHRLSFSYDNHSPTGRGDLLSLSGLGTEGGGMTSGRMAYATLLHPNGLRGSVALSRTEYTLGDVYADLGAKGFANSLELGLSYPILRTHPQTLEASLSLAKRKMEDRIQDDSTFNPKDLDSLTVGLNWRHEGRWLGLEGSTAVSVQGTVGRVALHDAASRTLDAAGAQTQGKFGKGSFSLTRLSQLPGNFSLALTLRHQRALTDKNLDASERMSVSGIHGVYAYPAGELSGSIATLAKAELSRPLPAWGDLSQSVSVFATKGHAKAVNALSSSDQGRSISDVGLGWKALMAPLQISAHLAHRLQKAEPTSETSDRTRLLVQAAWVF